MRQQAGRNNAYTLIEILVAVSVVSLLLGLLLSAVMNAREASRRLQCSSNLRQIVLAVTSYESAHTCYPLGRTLIHDPRYSGPNPPCTATTVDCGPFVLILPFLERVALYNSYNHSLTVFGPENYSATTTLVNTLVCPSDFAASTVNHRTEWRIFPPLFWQQRRDGAVALTSYAGAFGSVTVDATPAGKPNCAVPAQLLSEANGVFSDVHPIRSSSVSDGLSHTGFVSEKAASVLSQLRQDPALFRQHNWYFAGDIGFSLVSAMYPPGYKPGPLQPKKNHIAYTAASLHDGFVQTAFGDGSVRPVKTSVDSWVIDKDTGDPLGSYVSPGGWYVNLPPPGVWQALFTRSGTEAVREDGF